MVSRAPDGEDQGMFPDPFVPLGQVPATANRLERAAGELRERAGSPEAVPSLPQTLTHLDEAVGHLAAAMRQLAEATAVWCHPMADEANLLPEARALLWHLRTDADALSELREGIAVTRGWARRLVEDAAPDPGSGALTITGPADRAVGPAPASRR